jgi:hypothetical protein
MGSNEGGISMVVDYIVNGMVLVGVFYAATYLFGNEIESLIAKDTTA